MDFCWLFSDNLGVVDCFDNHWNWGCWFNDFFYFSDVLWNFNFFDHLYRNWHWYLNSHRNFNSFLFDDFIWYWNWHFNFHILFFYSRRCLNSDDLRLYNLLYLLNLMFYRNLLNSLYRLKGSNWLESGHRLHYCWNHIFHLDNRLLIKLLLNTIICWSSHISYWLINSSNVINRSFGYCRLLSIINNNSRVFQQSRRLRNAVIIS